MITYRKPPSLKDLLVRAKLSQPGYIKNLQNNKAYNTLRICTCLSNNLFYYLQCNWCHVKYVGQTRNKITDRFHGHIFDIKQHNSGKTFSWQQQSIGS